jgi:poly(beta-D-mannuronate) lyase
MISRYPLKTIIKILTLFLILFSVACGSSDETVPEIEAEEEVEEVIEEEEEEEVEEEEEEEEEEVVEEELNEPPSTNFDLSTWNISIPTDEDGNGKSDTIKEEDLNNGYQDVEYFYTADDGGMVFKCPIAGFKTSVNTSYTRTELREMLRAGNTDIDTQGVTKNNWVFGSAPQEDITNAGGYDGELNATLAVNYVTTTGDDNQAFDAGFRK